MIWDDYELPMLPIVFFNPLYIYIYIYTHIYIYTYIDCCIPIISNHMFGFDLVSKAI